MDFTLTITVNLRTIGDRKLIRLIFFAERERAVAHVFDDFQKLKKSPELVWVGGAQSPYPPTWWAHGWMGRSCDLTRLNSPISIQIVVITLVKYIR